MNHKLDALYDGVNDGVDNGIDHDADNVVVRGSLDGIHDGPDTVSLRASDGSRESSDVQHCGDSDGVKDSPVAPHPCVQVLAVDESNNLNCHLCCRSIKHGEQDCLQCVRLCVNVRSE